MKYFIFEKVLRKWSIDKTIKLANFITQIYFYIFQCKKLFPNN